MNTKYPLDSNFKSHFIIAISLALWVFFFLYFSEPLGVNLFTDEEKSTYLPLYAGLTAICYTIMYPIQSAVFKKTSNKWGFRNEILFLFTFIIITFLAMWLFYLNVVMRNELNPYSFFKFFKVIYFPAVLIIFPIVAVARYTSGKLKNRRDENLKIEITGDNNYEVIRLLESDLIFLESSDNYVEIHYQDNGILKKQIIRNRISVLEKQFPQLLKTHRSFLINKSHFLSFKKDKNKLGLILSHNLFIPVSKSKTTTVKEALNFTTEK